jgi:hypothetical protein
MKMKKQKLSERETYTPKDVPQVLCSVAMPLNRDDSLSEHGLKTSDNILDVAQCQHTDSQNLRVSGIVYVLNMRGQPLMPTTSPKARRLLRENKAKVVKRKPFTIQLTIATGENRQPITCKIDSGYKYVGFSCQTKKAELICGEVKLENKTSKRLTERLMYRRSKRNKLWYRQARFLNRKNRLNKLPPSIERNYQTHLNLIKKLEYLLPITNKIIEVGNFNIAKIENPDIEGVEYQQGNLFGYQNLKDFVLAREKGLCQQCGKEKKDKWALHHIKEKSNGGTDKPDNIALLHDSCHKELHQKGLKLKSKNKEYKDATFMNIIKSRFLRDIQCNLEYGYKTFCNRQELKLTKTHYNDAFCIGEIEKGVQQSQPFFITQKRRNNRSLQLNRKGFKPSIRRQRYKIQPHDLVWIDDKESIVKGLCNYGNQIRVEDDYFLIKQIQKHFSVGSLFFEKQNEVKTIYG